MTDKKGDKNMEKDIERKNMGLPFQMFVIGEPIGKISGDIGARFDFHKAVGQLLIYVDNPSAIEIISVQNGSIELGMTRIYGILFLTWRFSIGKKRVLEFETPYSIYLGLGMVDCEFDIPEEGQGYGVQMVLIDNITGIVKAIRIIGTSKEWSDDLRKICEEQRKEVFNIEIYNKFVDMSYREYTTQEIVEMSKKYIIKWKKTENNEVN